MTHGLMSLCSICFLFAYGNGLHAFSENKVGDSDENLISYIDINKDPLPTSETPNKNRNKPLDRQSYKLSEDNIQHSAPRTCYELFISQTNLSPSNARILCGLLFQNKLHGVKEMMKRTQATRKKTSLKQIREFLLGNNQDTEDMQLLMIEAKLLISNSNISNTDNLKTHEKSSSLPKASVGETTALLPLLANPGRRAASSLSKTKRRSTCRINSPLTIDEHQPLPWECSQRKQWRTLAGTVYPDRIYETVCEGGCMNGHYNCTPVMYTTHVVQFCSTGQCSDERTPSIYRNVWRFLDLEVTVGCACTR